MAKMIPPQPDSEAVESEKQVFRLMRDQLPDDWTVIHGKRFVLPSDGHRPPVEGEVDFIVLDPTRGYVGIEVKGGGIARDERGWYRRYKGKTTRIKPPGKQAQDNIHGIGRYLAQQPAFSNPSKRPRFGWAVCLPYLDVEESLGADLPREFVLDRGDLRDPVPAMERIFEANLCNTAVGPAAQNDWLRALAPVFSISASVTTRHWDADADIFRMTEEQKVILDSLHEVPRVGVKGPAGSGKTVLAVELARRWHSAGMRVLLLCYNRLLAEELSRNANGYVVQTFHSFCAQKIRSAGLRFRDPGDDDNSDFWETEAPETLSKVLDVYPDDRFDAVIVDEGQDFREYWWLVVEKLLNKPDEDRLWVFFDPNQNFYGGGPVESLGLMPASLTFNCRNTERIARYACEQIDAPLKVRHDAPKGLQVFERSCSDESAMVDEVRKSIHHLVSELEISPRDIVILSPRGRASRVFKSGKLGNFELVEAGSEIGPGQIAFSSVQRFKGLEAKAAILCDVDASQPLSSPTHLYVGTSRARHVLVVISFGGVS